VKKRVLIVEDNSLNCELLRDWLEGEGYETLIATNLNAAFAAVRTQQLDAVLLDIQLGPDDGLLLASWMLEQPVLCLIPVIAVTAQAMATEQRRILEGGCKCVVPKPVDFSVLQKQLQLWLRHAGALQENQLPGRK
jgi:two-component system, cell cycle response regulator DivK